jgi:hypothetical protein
MKQALMTLAAITAAGCSGGAGHFPAVQQDAGRDQGAPADHPLPPPIDDAAPAADLHGDYAAATGDPALLAIAGQLHGAFLEMECDSDEIEFQFCVPKDQGVVDQTLMFGGQAGKRYAVVLKVWGIVEGVLYSGGKALGEHFYAGGMGTTPMTAEYGLRVGNQTYYLNHFEMGAGDHYTYGMTYQTPAITIPGATPLVLYVHSPDQIVNTNHMQNEVMDPTPALADRLAKIQGEKVQGQFVYIEVQSAKLAP